MGVKDWLANPPSVDAVRPSCCSACGAASRPVGDRLWIHGHGLRDRMCLGPPATSSPGELQVVQLRRYLCCRCGAVMVVMPRGLLRGRLYAAAAISLALGLWGLLGQPSPKVRARVSPWGVVGDSARHRWATLRRWAVAGAAGCLFTGIAAIADPSHRVTAGRLATGLLGFTPPGDRHGDLETQLYLGGGHAM